ncbi:MAG TPA: hypothetical protein VFN79_01050 [Steroidobacteraceae bacterium]|nr:hypothetical protein [Steroidobacteraceae bacterium]
MGFVKRIWHDPVWSKVIAAGIIVGASQVITRWPSSVIYRWLDVPVTVTRGQLIIWPLQAVAALIAAAAVTASVRAHSAKSTRPARTATTSPQVARQDEANAPAPPDPPAAVGPPEDLEQLVTEALRLDGRFAEEEAYRKTLVSRYVRSSGAVCGVSSARDEGVTVSIQPYADDNRYVYVTFPKSMRERAFGLHKDDVVTITGKLTDTRGPWAYITGDGLQITQKRA